MTGHHEFTAIHPVPAEMGERGFRLLTLRQVYVDAAPPAFALIDQYILRRPERQSRHAVFFANTFRPEIMTWLSDQLGRPGQHDASGQACRNPRWPVLAWHREDKSWPDGTRTTEWLADVTFQDADSWAAFRERWAARLAGRSDDEHDEQTPPVA